MMGKRWFAQLQVSDMLAKGAGEVAADCPSCGNSWTAPIAFLPAATTLRTVAAMMLCPSCGSRNISIEPVLPDEKPTTH
jgi:predicted RNA-binding Zn-ribbon protein involved in translation (DUF1610 family)